MKLVRSIPAALVALALGCSGTTRQTHWERHPTGSVDLRPARGPEALTANLVPDAAAGGATLRLETSKPCTRHVVTTTRSIPTTEVTLDSPWVPWVDLVLGGAALWAALQVKDDTDLGDTLNPAGDSDAIDLGVAGGYAGLGTIFVLVAFGNAMSAIDEGGAEEVSTDERDEPARCQENRFPALAVQLTMDGKDLARGNAEKREGGYALPVALDEAAWATLGASSRFMVKVASQEPAFSTEQSLSASPELVALAEKLRQDATERERVLAAERERQAAMQAKWDAIKDGYDPAPVRTFLAAHPDFPQAPDVAAQLESLERTATVSTALDAALQAGTPDALRAGLEQAQALAVHAPPVAERTQRAACRLASGAVADDAAFTYALRWLRVHDKPEAWPCDAAETDAVWQAFERYFDVKVEIRGDFEGAHAYLHRWDDVLGQFAHVAEARSAKEAVKAIQKMRGKVHKAIAKLPKAERCQTPEAAATSCAFACQKKHEKALNGCEKKPDPAACATQVRTQIDACGECCKSGGPGCAGKAPFSCAP